LNLVPRGTKSTIFGEEFSPVAELRLNTRIYDERFR
jgi:hypothetical protein